MRKEVNKYKVLDFNDFILNNKNNPQLTNDLGFWPMVNWLKNEDGDIYSNIHFINSVQENLRLQPQDELNQTS